MQPSIFVIGLQILPHRPCKFCNTATHTFTLLHDRQSAVTFSSPLFLSQIFYLFQDRFTLASQLIHNISHLLYAASMPKAPSPSTCRPRKSTTAKHRRTLVNPKRRPPNIKGRSDDLIRLNSRGCVCGCGSMIKKKGIKIRHLRGRASRALCGK